MKQPSLREMLQNERRMNPLFHKGRQHTLVMVLIYIAARFSDPIAGTLLSSVPPELDFDLVFGLFVSVYIGWIAMLGDVKLAGVLCLLTPGGNTMAMMSAAKLYSGGFAEMLRRAPLAWYLLAMSVVCGAAGIALLTDRAIAAFGKRRKEIQKEYAAALKTWTNDAKRNEEERTEYHQPEIEKSPKEQAAAYKPDAVRYVPLYEEARVHNDADEIADKKPTTEKTPQEPEEETKDDLRRQRVTKYLAELEEEPFTLMASSIPTALAKVNKQRFFDLFRQMVCKEFGCCEEKVDPTVYILVFPENQLALMQWVPEEKKICIKSNTRRYGVQFHALMLEVISYLSKNMGVKFDIMDIE